MASEGVIQKEIIGALGFLSRLFRLNGGKAWMSNLGPKGVITLPDGSKLIKAPRPVGLGFTMTNGDSVPGQSDLGGWTKVTITPEMVGKDIAVFTAIETKRSKGGKASDDQLNFVDQVQRQGGIAGIANSVDAARKIIEQWASKIGAIL
jgi:hypothetical protein